MRIRKSPFNRKTVLHSKRARNKSIFNILPTLFIVLILLGSKSNANAQAWKYPETLDSKIESVLNLEFNLTLNPEEQIKQPSTTLDNLPVSLQIIITSLLTGTKERLEWATKENDKLIADILKTENKSGQWKYVYIRLLINKTMLHALQQEYLTTIWSFYKTYNLLTETIVLYPNLTPLHTLADLFNKGLTRSIEYDSMLRFLLPNTIKTDSTLLKQNWSTVEKPLFDAFNIFFLKDPEAASSPIPTPKTKTEELVYAIYFLNTHNPSRIAEIRNPTPFKQSPIDNFIKGWSYLTSGNYALARKHLNAQLNEKNTALYKRTSMVGSFYMDIIENQLSNKSNYQKRLQQLPKSIAWRDKMAEKELTLQHNPQLLQARLLCDGQKLKEALTILTTMNSKTITHDNLLEFHYRKGRILFLQKEYSKALVEYQDALNPTIAPKSYYKAQAAFDCGEIFQERKESANAIKYYKSSLEHANKANRNDIAIKANTALRNFKN